MYPALPMKDWVDAGLIPPDMKVQEHPFYYLASKENNPARDVVWTEPYLDFTPKG